MLQRRVASRWAALVVTVRSTGAGAGMQGSGRRAVKAVVPTSTSRPATAPAKRCSMR
ncbi:hypothetical protein SMD44_08402 [Streptomyces alboflavus]|uniref:Uncharacterized protein n=1 Tax=Streptomyces alboflavus TaxID=67267 RepID=A0A1Z1WR58_9ACTN|nr:hypothetical protein SMD44_08402 [Streptomyces alboflavus]